MANRALFPATLVLIALCCAANASAQGVAINVEKSLSSTTPLVTLLGDALTETASSSAATCGRLLSMPVVEFPREVAIGKDGRPSEDAGAVRKIAGQMGLCALAASYLSPALFDYLSSRPTMRYGDAVKAAAVWLAPRWHLAVERVALAAEVQSGERVLGEGRSLVRDVIVSSQLGREAKELTPSVQFGSEKDAAVTKVDEFAVGTWASPIARRTRTIESFRAFLVTGDVLALEHGKLSLSGRGATLYGEGKLAGNEYALSLRGSATTSVVSGGQR
ncbi:hypothetical protein GH865_12985 [Rhodocyclus tenuis]|uniref:Uncharacterized protein n=1 Tax=Rhodocyclus tenuis TaxID=1066 RepID=A0A6L5JWX8_RHOTE|nr:hypothetical protein [Rhodocyclus gracilis]MQY51312.1 hypothetical protein [Rhodocyclus gracilis]MRD74153.1 hypothetical protein [Rhodocyclus gracilis]